MENTPGAQSYTLLDQVRNNLRVKHYAIRTEEQYLHWIKRYILFHGKRHPKEMGAAQIDAFLTGTPASIDDVARRYAVFQKKRPPDDVEHTFLTSLIDAKGVLRVQYQGVEFSEDEFIEDLRALVR